MYNILYDMALDDIILYFLRKRKGKNIKFKIVEKESYGIFRFFCYIESKFLWSASFYRILYFGAISTGINGDSLGSKGSYSDFTFSKLASSLEHEYLTNKYLRFNDLKTAELYINAYVQEVIAGDSKTPITYTIEYDLLARKERESTLNHHHICNNYKNLKRSLGGP